MDRQEKVKQIVDRFAVMNYGESLTHAQIREMIGLGKADQSYRYLISQAQKQLLGFGKMIECVRGVGYRVVQPDQYTTISARCVTSGVKRINKGIKVLANAPVKDMTQDGLQAYNAVRDRMMILQAAVTGAKVEINMLSTKRPHPLATHSNQGAMV